ncbi:MAG: putative polymerase subfamily sigma factor [Acidimicrobiales bacterium]|nr:putative polymerase subfamily sigma factor [Acidimicrobiales bacterium]
MGNTVIYQSDMRSTLRDVGTTTDHDLVEAAGQGNAAAFDLLFARHRATVQRAAERILGDATEAQDAVQLTFVKTWKAVAKLDPGKPFGPWVRTAARRVAIDLVRSRNRRLGIDIRTAEYEISAELSCAATTERNAVRHAVTRLPDIEQQVVLLTYFGGLTHQEVASWLDVPVGTVKSRSHRAHGRLAEMLADI